MSESIKIEISRKSIFFIVLMGLSLWVVYRIKDIILSFFVALLIMSILNPTISKLTKNKISRPFSVIIVYILMLFVFGSSLAILVPPLVSESTNFVTGLPKYLNRVEIFGIYADQIIRQVIAQLGAIPGQLPKIVISFFSNALSVVTVLILSFYLLIYREKLDVQLGFFFNEEKRKEIGKILDLLEKGLGGWARGQLFLMFVIWVSTYLGLLLLGIPFALPLSILAGLLELIPYRG